METRGGALVHLRSAWWKMPGRRIWRFEIIGTKGFASYDWKTFSAAFTNGRSFRAKIPANQDPVVPEVRAFLDYVRSGGPSPTPFSAGLSALAGVEAEKRSLKSGRTIRV